METMKSDGLKKMKFIVGDLSGENYRNFLEYILTICPFFSMIDDFFGDRAEETLLFQKLSEYLVKEKRDISEWPGTVRGGVYSLEEDDDESQDEDPKEVTGNSEFQTNIFTYKFNRNTLELLYKFSDNMWRIAPFDDLTFYRENEEVFFVSVTHEWMWWIKVDEKEEKAMKDALPFIEIKDEYLYENLDEKYGYDTDYIED